MMLIKNKNFYGSKKSFGFTLIELLAIIVILAIIAVITVPIILRIIDESKKGAVKNSAYGYKDSINKFIMGKVLEDSSYNLEDGDYATSELEIAGLNVNGSKPDSNSWVTMEKNDVVEGCLQFDEYKIEISDGRVGEAVKGECNPILSPGIYDENNNLLISYDNFVSNSSSSLPSDVPSDVPSDENDESSIYESITEIVIPKNVTSINNLNFVDYPNLRSIVFESGSQLTSIGEDAFSGCRNLTHIEFGRGSQLTSIGENAFFGTGLKTITIPSSVTSIGEDAFFGIMVLYYDGSAVDEYNNNWGAKHLNPYLLEGDFAYSDNSKTELVAYVGNATSVVIPSSVISIGANAFADSNLVSVTIPSSVTSIGNRAFGVCESLTSVTFESESHLISIGDYAFGETALISITIPSSVTSIGEDAFFGVVNLYYTGSAVDGNNDNWGASNLNP